MCYKLPLPEYPGNRPRCYDQIAMELQERVLPLMTVTEAAAAKIKQLIAEEEDVSVLRVAIQGGGCSGFQYGLGFDRGAADGDLEFEMHGVQVVVDPFSAPYLKGAEIDFVCDHVTAFSSVVRPTARSIDATSCSNVPAPFVGHRSRSDFNP